MDNHDSYTLAAIEQVVFGNLYPDDTSIVKRISTILNEHRKKEKKRWDEKVSRETLKKEFVKSIRKGISDVP